MKIVFQQVPQWQGTPHAEAELSRRMMHAAQTLGFNALESCDLDEIDRFHPDIIFPLHFFVPKLFDAFTVGCMWNPTYAIERNKAWDNVKSYDGYGVASVIQEQLVRAFKFKSPVPYLIAPLYPSTNTTVFSPPKQFASPVYIGSNWSKDRHKDFFLEAKDIHIHGPKKSWQYLEEVGGKYQGEIPFDGKSALMTYHQAGIGLALHHESHNREGIPSMRPFEIAASGAVMIADQNDFVQRVFGDNALYLDTELESVELAEQLEEHIRWIKSHQDQAREMASACHEIFCQQYSLEVLLEGLVNDVIRFKQERKSNLASAQDLPSVELIVRSDGQEKKRLVRALHSIQRQTYPCVKAHVLFRGKADDISELEEAVKQELPALNVCYTHAVGEADRGTQFYSGLRSTTAAFVGFLDHDDVVFHDHVAVMMEILLCDQDAALVYGGSVKVWEDGDPPEGELRRKLAYFHDMEGFLEKAFITSNSYLVRRTKIPWQIMNLPIPSMACREDRLFLQLLYRDKAKFIFSEKVTAAFLCNVSKKGHSNENDEMLEQGKVASDLILRSATSPWRHAENTPPVREILTLKLAAQLLAAIKNDFQQISLHLKNFFK
ncbi:MAG: glycosyltransferase [Candidatus Electrothrix scaldis]|nr:MAG: glycosyltransferase [Candidatus Electrothrix sp. GW3-3]